MPRLSCLTSAWDCCHVLHCCFSSLFLLFWCLPHRGCPLSYHLYPEMIVTCVCDHYKPLGSTSFGWEPYCILPEHSLACIYCVLFPWQLGKHRLWKVKLHLHIQGHRARREWGWDLNLGLASLRAHSLHHHNCCKLAPFSKPAPHCFEHLFALGTVGCVSYTKHSFRPREMEPAPVCLTLSLPSSQFLSSSSPTSLPC